jgi:hypothetical protein
MSGIGFNNRFAFTNGDTNYDYPNVGQWIDGLFASNSGSVQTVDATTQRVPLDGQGYMGWQLDQNGNPGYKQILGVRRTLLSSLGTFQILNFLTQNGSSIFVSSQTPICTRVNNVIDGKTADQWQTGDMICCGTHSYVLSTPPRAMEYMVNMYSAIPGIITATWGELSCSRNDCAAFVDVCDNYPDQVDPSDKDVFEEVLGELAIYDPVLQIRDYTSQYTNPYIYWIETENNCFQLWDNSALLGYPVPGPVYKPLQRGKVEAIKSDKGTSDSGKVLKQFNKESKTETGPVKLQVKKEE